MEDNSLIFNYSVDSIFNSEDNNNLCFVKVIVS